LVKLSLSNSLEREVKIKPNFRRNLQRNTFQRKPGIPK